MGAAGGRAGRRCRRPVGRLSRRRARGRALPAGSGAAEARAAAASPSRAQFRATSVAPTSAAPRRSRRSGASSSTSRAPTRRSPKRVVTVSPDVASSTNLGGWINHVRRLEHGRAHRLVRRRPADAHALARVVARPAHRARHRGGQPRRPAGRARSDLVARRAAAAADRHALRPVRQPRARAVVVRHLRGRAVDPRRARRRASRSRPRAARTSRSSRRRSASSSRAASPGSRPSGRTSSGRCSRRSGASDTPAAARPTSGSARARSTRPSRASPASRPRASSAARHVLAGGYVLREAERAPDVALVGMGAILPDVLAAAEELSAAGLAVDVICLTSADLVFRALQARQGLGDGDARDPRRALPGRSGAPRSSPCSTATRTRSRFSRRCAACRSRTSA